MNPKELVVIGDRVLIQVDDSEKRTEVGLYLPDTVRDKEEVMEGTIIKTGRGTPLVEPTMMTDWSSSEVSVKYMPMEAKPGDYALFLKKAAIELEFEGEKYHILPQSAILILIRETPDDNDELV